MSCDPILAKRNRRTAPKGGELGLPTNCQLGRISGSNLDKACPNDAYKVIAGVRICKSHWKRVMQIKRDALKAKVRALKKPRADVRLRHAA